MVLAVVLPGDLAVVLISIPMTAKRKPLIWPKSGRNHIGFSVNSQCFQSSFFIPTSIHPYPISEDTSHYFYRVGGRPVDILGYTRFRQLLFFCLLLLYRHAVVICNPRIHFCRNYINVHVARGMMKAHLNLERFPILFLFSYLIHRWLQTLFYIRTTKLITR
jgi:hypothetical protein